MTNIPLEERLDWCEAILKGRTKILENVRILVCKENPTLFELLDYENDRIFNEPFLFAYFYANRKEATIEQLLFGHIEKSKRPKSIQAVTDAHGLLYLPEIGWFKTTVCNQAVTIAQTDSDIGLLIEFQGNTIPFRFEPTLLVANTSFEIISHQHPLLAPHFFDSRNRLVNVEIDHIAQAQKENLTKAFTLIRNFVPHYYKLLEQAIQKVMIFNDPEVKRNSFATVSVHGCSFFNSFQKEYDDIFFVEDIAHQCGHVIFNNITHGNHEIFRVSPETIIKEKGFFGMIVNMLEDRTLFVAFHALFTYYSITTCLEACIVKASLTPMQKHEAMGRLAFCFRKYKNDINLLGKVNEESKSIYFTEVGLELYQPMEALYNKIKMKWGEKLRTINLFNQPYNFSVKNFHKSNPLK